MSNSFKTQQANPFSVITMPTRQNFRTDFSIIVHLSLSPFIRTNLPLSTNSHQEALTVDEHRPPKQLEVKRKTKSHLHCYRSNAANTQEA